jgi:hypothetical protein
MLPKPSTRLPREKPVRQRQRFESNQTNCIGSGGLQVPESMPKTKWQQFAEMKGIPQKKRSRMVFDEAAQVRTSLVQVVEYLSRRINVI